MKKKIINWLLDKVGIIDAFGRIMQLEIEVAELKTEISGLKMESDILYAKSLKK